MLHLILNWLMFALMLISFYFPFKRLQDTNLNKWLVLLNVVPYLSCIPFLICLFKKGASKD
ncbi:DUF805 domain-containing protein [Enterococcus sp. DIV1420a]|uniref:DUF805 domain-containing protein n=1 Tax=Enterococcus TaxID=1350 RepID=UPI003F68313B